MSDAPISLLAWKPITRNSLRGFARLRLGRALIVSDVAVYVSHGRRWAQLPGKPVLGPDGVAQKDSHGKTKWIPVIEWIDRATADKFSEAVIAAVEREHPGATAA